MLEIIRLFLTLFAAYRLAALIASEEGPYLPFLYKDVDERGVFEWLRGKLGANRRIYTFDEHGNRRVKVATNLGRGISCPLCVGGYVSVLLIFLIYFDNIVTNFLIAWLGIWGAQVFLENLTSDDALKDAIEDVSDSLEAE
jgi:hypothetical protein